MDSSTPPSSPTKGSNMVLAEPDHITLYDRSTDQFLGGCGSSPIRRPQQIKIEGASSIKNNPFLKNNR